MKKWLLIFLCLPLLAGAVQAGGFDPDDVVIQVVGDERGVLREIPAGGHGKVERAYVVARRGERYRIRVRNRTGERIGLVIAVDGRNIITGRKSWLGRHEAKYVLGPWESAEYEGWRTARNRVHRFYFTDAADSYAEAWGDDTAMGVIAVAVYREKRHHRPKKWAQRREGLHRPRAEAARPGTGFGEGTWSPSRRVDFEPRKKPALKKFIKYEWRSTLCRRGLITCRHHRHNRFWPDDDWDDDPDDRFAPPPWQLQMDRW